MESPQKGNAVIQDGTDHDFVWEDYLEDTNSVAAPPTAFTHVEYSLESGFKVGMKLEIPSSDDCSSYWIATVIMTCGELLSLRYAGCADDRSADFWYNVKSGNIHPVGWCSANKRKLWPPKIVMEKCADINALLLEELNNLDSTSTSLSEDLAASFMPIDQIKTGMKLEVLEEFNPQHVWIATIIQNIGGRLLLKYDTTIDNVSEEQWLFYLSDRLQPVGYGENYNLTYSPPQTMKKSDVDWDAVLKQSRMEAKNFQFPTHIFEPKIPVEVHGFKEGMKLEAVDPKHYINVCPATVSKIVNDYYFIVTIDDYQAENNNKRILCCHSNSPFIFPIRWAEENNVAINVPEGYPDQGKFSWDTYLQYCKASPAPPELFLMCCMNMGFENGMKCEAADPFSPSIIKAATIENIIEPLMWLRFDSEETETRIITSINSYDVYPVGWCASNCYSLQVPCSYKRIKIKENPFEKCTQIVPTLSPTEQQGKSWCPKIYFNHRCFSGPLLSKKGLAELPIAIGPGAVDLVIPEVITRVVNIAYKSSQVLQLLQTTGKCSPCMKQKEIKAKRLNGKSHRAIIEVVQNTEQVEEFCKTICTKLECCPYLFGPKHITEEHCPSNCFTRTKTKFGYNFVKKHKKVGRPPLSSNSVSPNPEEYVKKGPGRRKKRKHWTHLLKEFNENSREKLLKSRDSSENEEIRKPDIQDGEEKPVQSAKIPLVGKKKLKLTPSSNIVTRGAKLPNFGLWHHVSSFHSRRGRPRTRPIRPFPVIPGRKVGRPIGSTKKAIADAQARNKKLLENDRTSDIEVEEKVYNYPPHVSKLQSNPLEWSVEDVVKYLQKTECAPLAPLIKDQEIDGQALLMLNKCNVQEYLHLKPEPTEKFCYLIKRLKIEYFTSYRT